jgi:hypothetical protein
MWSSLYAIFILTWLVSHLALTELNPGFAEAYALAKA